MWSSLWIRLFLPQLHEDKALVKLPNPFQRLEQQRQQAFRESFRQLAISVRALEATNQLRVLLVMSAYPRDGRTTTVANLGIALAEGECSVLLVDTDLRRASLAALLGLPAQPLVNEALAQGSLPVDDDQMIGLATTYQNIRAQTATAVPADMVMPNLLKTHGILQSASQFDYVILDSPPCLRYADAFQYASQVDGVIYVVRKRRQDSDTQQRIQTQLRQVGGNLVGVVFNDA
jgi:receptor protein-tyrosine kinase